MAAPAKKEPKKKDPELDEDLDLEEEEEEEEAAAKKKPAAKNEEDMPAWAKQIIKLLTPQQQPPEAKIIPAPKAPARAKEDEEDQERAQEQNQQQQEAKPSQTFLGWFW